MNSKFEGCSWKGKLKGNFDQIRLFFKGRMIGAKCHITKFDSYLHKIEPRGL